MADRENILHLIVPVHLLERTISAGIEANSGGTYLFGNAEDAVAEADEGFARFETESRLLDEAAFASELSGKDWRECLEVSGRVRFFGSIPDDKLMLKEMWVPAFDVESRIFSGPKSEVFATYLSQEFDMDLLLVRSMSKNAFHVFAVNGSGAAFDAEGMRPISVATEWAWQRHGDRDGESWNFVRVSDLREVLGSDALPDVEVDMTRAADICGRLFPFLESPDSYYPVSSRS